MEKISQTRLCVIGIRIDSWRAFIRRLRHYCSEWQWHWQCDCQTTVPVVHRFTGGPSGSWQTEPPQISTITRFSVLKASQGRQAPSSSQLKRLHTSHNRHLCMQYKSIWCSVFHQKHKNKIQVSRMQHQVVCHPIFWGILLQTAFLRIS
jgi:hypothetical protein